MKIGFLHTSAAHFVTFDDLLAGVPGAQSVHIVKEEWVAEAVARGVSRKLELQVTNLLAQMARDSDVVICTCSRLGRIAQDVRREDVFRVDEPMMEQAADHGDVLLVMCLESTVEPSSSLLEAAFRAKGKIPTYRTLVCSDAWQHFETGDPASFGRSIASAIRRDLASHEEPGCIVLAQTSMRVAVSYLAGNAIPVLSSPESAVDRAIALATG